MWSEEVQKTMISNEQKKTTDHIEEMTVENENRPRFSVKRYLLLQILLFVTSFSAVFTKKAAGETFLSFRFCLFYAGILFLCVVNALLWQQVIKKFPLTFAYSNRAIGIVWTMIWSKLFFADDITPKKIAGVVIVIIGICMYSLWGHNGKE